MNTNKIPFRLLLVLVYTAMLSFQPLSPAHSPHDFPTKRALLIGINQYTNLDPEYQLHGCVNDITLMRDLLIQQGFAKDNIDSLTDNRATKKGILSAFSTLIKATGSGDIVVIHMSCHGSQVLDLRHKEFDGLSETLIPSDYINTCKDARATSIVDYEMDSLLTLLTAKTKKVTIILDACHSYGATKNLTTLRPRFIDPILSHQDSIKLKEIQGKAKGSTPELKIIGNANYTLIAGCASNELSNEYPAPDNKAYGALTWFLIGELRRTNGPQLWPDIIQNVRADVQGVYPRQTPQSGGANADSYVFGDNTYFDHRFYYVSPGKDGLVDVRGGAAYGLDSGSILSVYLPGTVDLDDTTKIPVAKIELTKVGGFTSKARILSGTIQNANSKAKEVRHNFNTIDLNLIFGGNWGNLLPLKTAITTLPAVRENPQDPDLLVYARQNEIRITLAKDTSVILDEFPLDNAINSSLVNSVKKWQHWFHVLGIQNPTNPASFSISLRRIYSAPRALKSLSEQLYHPNYVFNDHDSVELRIVNHYRYPLCFHVLDLRDDGVIDAYTFGKLAGRDDNKYIPAGDSAAVSFPVWIRAGRTSALDVMKVYGTMDGNVTFDNLGQGSGLVSPYSQQLLVSKELGVGPVNLDGWGTATKIFVTR